MVIGFQIPPENTLMKGNFEAGNLGNVRSTASAVCQGLFPPLKQPTDGTHWRSSGAEGSGRHWRINPVYTMFYAVFFGMILRFY